MLTSRSRCASSFLVHYGRAKIVHNLPSEGTDEIAVKAANFDNIDTPYAIGVIDNDKSFDVRCFASGMPVPCDQSSAANCDDSLLSFCKDTILMCARKLAVKPA